MSARLNVWITAVLFLLTLGVTVSAHADPQDPGMIGGYGYGPGYGMGPGMMGGWGQGYGMGPGMMGGYGPGYGMGPGMMGGWGPMYGLNLDEKQREKLANIQDNLAKKRWELMGKMHDEQFKLRELYASGKRDEAAIEKSFKRMEELRRQMFDAMMEARTQMNAVLTPEQRERLYRRGPWW
jgi:Spy/CpxP family protein refolding chaperone